MSNESPAQLLAAVLRVAARHMDWEVFDGDTVAAHDDDAGEWKAFDPDSKDDLARVVAMLTAEQAYQFDMAMLWKGESGEVLWQRRPSEVLKADTKTILAALVAATGARV